jgi:HAD superfamily hydrolase (TIGR01549 family)
VQRLALFDLDNTLVDRQLAFHAWAQEFADAHGPADEAAGWLVAADGQGLRPRGQFFREVRERYRLTESSEELWAAFRSRMPELVRCDPQVLDGLSQLRESGWRVGIVSNGMADTQLAKIRRTGLSERLDGCCVSGEVGIRKPDVRIFRLAAARCGLGLAGGGWMVGDSPGHDIAGGRAAGLRTVWVDRHGMWAHGETGPDLSATDAPTAINLLLTSD